MSTETMPVDETRRVEILREYDVLYRPQEGELGELSALAAHLCETPMALISLLDEDRQWFKGCFGLDAAEPPLEVSFCAQGLAAGGMFIVRDATLDERFTENPLVTGQTAVRFYAGAPLVTPEGAVLGMLCVMDTAPRELTARQQAALTVLARQVIAQMELRRQRNALAESEERLQAFMDNNPAATWIVDAEGKFRYANASFYRMVEVGSADIVGRSLDELFEPDFAKEYVAGNRLVLAERRVLETVDPGRRPDGTVGQFLTVKFPFDGRDGALLGGMAMDITERQTAEDALRDSEARFAGIFRANPAAIGITRLETSEVIDVNERMSEFFGWPREEVLGKKVLDLDLWAVPSQRVVLMEQMMRVGSVRDAEVKLRRRNGEVRDVLLSLERVDFPGEKKPMMMTMFVDVTDRKRAEESVREHEQILRETGHIAKVGGWEFNPETGEGSWTDEVAHIHETDPTESTSRDLGLSFFRGKSRARIEAALEEAIAQGTPYDLELELTTAKGNRKWIRTICRPVIEDGRVVKIRGSYQDITERKWAEARFRRLFDSNTEGIFFWDRDGKVLQANDAFLEVSGYSHEDLLAGEISWSKMTPLEYAHLDEQALEEMTTRGTSASYEKEYFRKDGSRVPILIGSATFEDNSEEGVAFVIDLTERKALEKQFLRSQRMESVGSLAGGIAHDLNNVLGPIIMSIDLLKAKFPDPQSRELIDIISISARHGADMVRQVLSFARGVEGHRREVQVTDSIREIENIANDTFSKEIHVRTILQPELWSVIADRTQLHQVLLNLCVNARDAMAGRGTLTLSAQNFTLDAHFAAISWKPDAQPGPYVAIQITDTGAGMPPEVVEKIFDPFFTTKETGSGTGLGLSTTQSIVKSHGGFIRVESVLGRGTTVRVYLPAQVEAAPAAPEVPVEIPHGHGELILVIDDQASVREITGQTLRAFGYEVALAADGPEAIGIYARKSGEVAVVLTDMMMPVMDGPATIRVLQKINPAVRIIGTSGLADSSHVSEVTKLGVRHFLPKPYTAETLLKTLRQLLLDAS